MTKEEAEQKRLNHLDLKGRELIHRGSGAKIKIIDVYVSPTEKINDFDVFCSYLNEHSQKSVPESVDIIRGTYRGL